MSSGDCSRIGPKDTRSTDLILTMTPHIIRIADITEDDLRPMWVGTSNNMTFRGLTPRMESQTSGDPFTPAPGSDSQFQNRVPPTATPERPVEGPPMPPQVQPAPEIAPEQPQTERFDPFDRRTQS